MWALLLALVLPSRAAAWPDLARLPTAPAGDGRQDAALIIAIEDYAKVEDVKGARSNGDAWYLWLVRDRKVPLERVHYLKDGDAVDHKIRQKMASAASEVGEEGKLWLIFIGHGVPRPDGQPMLVGADAPRDLEGIYSRSLTRAELLSSASSLGEGRAVVILDACFTGETPTGQSLAAEGLQSLVPVQHRIERSQATVLSATSQGQFAGRLPGRKVPAFSYLALGALRGWADDDADGQVSAGEVVTWTRRAMVATVKDRTQTPELAGPDQVLAQGGERGPDVVAMVVGKERAVRKEQAPPEEKPEALVEAEPPKEWESGSSRATRRWVGVGLATVGTASLVTGQVWRANALAIASRDAPLAWGDAGTALAVNLATVGGLGLMAGGGGLVVSAGFGGRQTSVEVGWSW